MLSLNRIPLLVLAGMVPVAFVASVSCSSETSGGGNGGSNAAGGAANGGAATGGAANGGASNGGSGTGGSVGMGGATGSGGAAAGGTPGAGGAASGGSSNNGGSTSGGSSNGGSTNSNGGSSNGGTTGNGGGAAKGGGAGQSSGGTAGASSGGSGGGGGATGFVLTSPNHTDGAMFASKYTCADKGFSGSVLPALNWTEGPSGTKSYAITFIDTTLSKQNDPKGYHWVIWNIPASVKSLPEALTDAQAKAIPAKENSAFLGPCPNFGTAPPTGSKTDNYEFTLYALSTDMVDITGSNIVMAAETKLEGSNLAKTKLTGKSNAANNK
ncbi:MAG: YbhB/YbcL family Raf kinase inhibitor-like protein [Myxococcota bacterium]